MRKEAFARANRIRIFLLEESKLTPEAVILKSMENKKRLLLRWR